MKEIKEAKVQLGLFTYKDMGRPEMREVMANRPVSSLGTQSGNFGKFTEQFRVLSKTGANELRMELEAALGSTELLEHCPTLKSLLA